MRELLTAAFDIWETDFREHPENYLTTEQVVAMETKPLAEGRADCLLAILEQIGKGAVGGER